MHYLQTPITIISNNYLNNNVSLSQVRSRHHVLCSVRAKWDEMKRTESMLMNPSLLKSILKGWIIKNHIKRFRLIINNGLYIQWLSLMYCSFLICFFSISELLFKQHEMSRLHIRECLMSLYKMWVHNHKKLFCYALF